MSAIYTCLTAAAAAAAAAAALFMCHVVHVAVVHFKPELR